MTFFCFSLGCKVNAYENEAIKSLLLKKGYIEDNKNPDIVIINTCSVTAVADQKSRQHIRKFKNNFPAAIIVVMGCYAQGNSKIISQDIKADIIVGTSNRNKIPTFIEQFVLNKKQIVEVDDNPRKYRYEELGITSYSENARAYLKIGDGCDNFCSYCLIPYRRGKLRSRNRDIVLQEANELVKNGYKEIVLTGIHVGGYGKDDMNYSFSALVEDILNIPNLYRLRISSLEESEIDEKLISFFSKYSNLAYHLHIPLQSGSNSVLKRMNRKYQTEEFLNKIKQIKEKCPNICLTTDVIVGFPGETDEEFNECFNFIKQCDFNMLHIFPFSSREGTLAAKMDNQINPNIKKERVKKLLDLSKELWDKYTNKFINKEVDVLVEQYDNKTKTAKGHSSNYLEIEVHSNCDCTGKIIKTIYKK